MNTGFERYFSERRVRFDGEDPRTEYERGVERHALAVSYIYTQLGESARGTPRGRPREVASRLSYWDMEDRVRELVGELPEPELIPMAISRRAKPLGDIATDAELIHEFLKGEDVTPMHDRMWQCIQEAQTAELQEVNHA